MNLFQEERKEETYGEGILNAIAEKEKLIKANKEGVAKLEHEDELRYWEIDEKIRKETRFTGGIKEAKKESKSDLNKELGYFVKTKQLEQGDIDFIIKVREEKRIPMSEQLSTTVAALLKANERLRGLDKAAKKMEERIVRDIVGWVNAEKGREETSSFRCYGRCGAVASELRENR